MAAALMWWMEVRRVLCRSTDTLNDTANLSGTSNLTGLGSVTIYLYAPGVTCHTDGSGTTVYSQTFTSVSTNGPFTTSPGYGPPLVAGVYHWLAVFSGDANNAGAQSGCTSEPVTITASPTIGTTANPTSGTAPVILQDSATLANTSNLLG